jgi:hypothetical protein
LIKESIAYFERIQKDYLVFLQEAWTHTFIGDISIYEILSFINEIKMYWLKRLELIRYHLDILSNQRACFLLCGAIYLDTKNNGHYLFKALGDHHIVSDPFLKLETIFRVNISKPDQKENIAYFKKVLKDVQTILSNYPTSFYILPIHELNPKNKEEHLSLLNKFFWLFISGIFPRDYSNQEDFLEDYQSFDKIEKDINGYVKKNLIFLGVEDDKFPLIERINNYCEKQSNLHILVKDKSDSEKFILSLHNYIYQIMDIILICSSFNLIPFIRYEVTFRYLTLIMHTFKEDKSLGEMIEKTIIFYILYNVIDREKMFGVEFAVYCKILSDKNILGNILDRKEKSNIDFIDDGIKSIREIIVEEFDNIFN